MLHNLFTKEINGKMSGGLNTSASNCISSPESADTGGNVLAAAGYLQSKHGGSLTILILAAKLTNFGG